MINMKKKKSFYNNPLSQSRWGTMSQSCRLSTPISYLWTINQPSIVQMTSNLAQGCAVTWQMMFETMPCQFRLKFLENSCKNSNLRVQICETSIDRTKIASLASCEARDGVMHGTSHCDHKHHLWTPPKSFIHYFTNNSSQTIVWPELPKFITNSKLLKIFWNLHLWHICIK